jgi:hypothetical protein
VNSRDYDPALDEFEGEEGIDPAFGDVGSVETSGAADQYPTSSPDDPNDGYPTSSPDGEGQAPGPPADGTRDIPYQPPGPGPDLFKLPPERCDESSPPDNMDQNRVGPPEMSDNPTVGPAPSNPQPYVPIADQVERMEREADVRTGLTFGAVVYGVTGNLEFAEMVNGFASAGAGTASGRNSMSPNPIGNPESPSPSKPADIGPASPGASAAPPSH